MSTTTNRFARRIAALAALAVVPALAIGISPIANAAQPAFSPCDTNPSSSDPIWKDVDPAKYTPGAKTQGNNLDLVWPHDDSSLGYAVRYGEAIKGGVPGHDLLVVPTVRELGIECPNLLSPNAPEYFTHAYDERGLMTGNDWALAINSKSGRRLNQLHIHLTQLDRNTRADIDKAFNTPGKVATNEGDWAKSVVTVQGTTTTPGVYAPRDVRLWNVKTLNHNFFEKLNDNIVKKLHTTMADETLLITSAPGGKGFIVLTSDNVSGLKHGVNNVETFLHKA